MPRSSAATPACVRHSGERTQPAPRTYARPPLLAAAERRAVLAAPRRGIGSRNGACAGGSGDWLWRSMLSEPYIEQRRASTGWERAAVGIGRRRRDCPRRNRSRSALARPRTTRRTCWPCSPLHLAQLDRPSSAQPGARLAPPPSPSQPRSPVADHNSPCASPAQPCSPSEPAPARQQHRRHSPCAASSPRTPSFRRPTSRRSFSATPSASPRARSCAQATMS